MELDNPRRRRWAKNNLIRKTNRHYIICEVLREIYDEIHNFEDTEQKERIVNHLIDALLMAKSMSDRLHYYKDTYKDITGKGGTGFLRIKNIKERKMIRIQRDI